MEYIYTDFIKAIILFLSVGTLLIVGFSMNISRTRMQLKIFAGDGGNANLQYAIRAHLNFIEHYVPFALVMVAYMFVSGGLIANIFAFGFLFFKTIHSLVLIGGNKSNWRFTFIGVMLAEITIPILLLVKLF